MNSIKPPRKPAIRPAIAKSTVSPARHAAFKILMAVELGQAHSDDLLRGRSVSALTPQDRHLATTLVLGVLRWQIQLDDLVRQYLKRPNARLDPEVRLALRLGAFQIRHLDRIPARAAIDESVELARQAGHKFASGMVNAVLRKLAAKHELTGAASSAADPANREVSVARPNQPVATGKSRDSSPREEGIVSVEDEGFGSHISSPQEQGVVAPEDRCDEASAAHPRWLVERWSSFFGPDRTCALCRHNQQPPALTIRVTTSEAERELLDAGIALRPGAILTAARTVTSGDIFATRVFREGRVRIQDEGSQLVAELAATSIDQKSESILDACAAPGGKTLILAERHPEAHINACESNAGRLEKLRERMDSLAPNVECRQADATALDYESSFDLVLADVPCSGTGTLSRNPEIRHRLSPDELPRQAERQRAILRSALRAVRPGGRVVYSTCSLEPEENEQVLAAVLADNPAARIVPPQSVVETMLGLGTLLAPAADGLRESITPEGYLRLSPDSYGSDGFFIAILERAHESLDPPGTPVLN
jgi:16S rRNA (cytosine967-C5)-methyltransferase